MLFPGKMYCFKCHKKNSYSMLYQHSNIIKSSSRGETETGRTERSWERLRRLFSIYSIFLDIRKSIFYIKKIISWYQLIDFLTTRNLTVFFQYQEMGFIFLYQKFNFFISMISKIESIFISKNRLFDIKKYRINSKTTRYLFHIFLCSWYKSSFFLDI